MMVNHTFSATFSESLGHELSLSSPRLTHLMGYTETLSYPNVSDLSTFTNVSKVLEITALANVEADNIQWGLFTKYHQNVYFSKNKLLDRGGVW